MTQADFPPDIIADSEQRPLGDAPYWGREHFIPLRRTTLISRLVQQTDVSEPERADFRHLAQLLSSTFHYEFHRRLELLKDAYAPFNPDADTRTLEQWSPSEREQLQSQLFGEFREVLERANYRQLTQTEIEEAVGTASEWGLRLHVDFQTFARLDVFVRGDVLGRRRRRRWRTLWREEEVDVPIYQRLVVIFALRSHDRLEKHIDTSAVYVKLFKNIPKLDIDMLLPGGRIRMTWIDQGKILFPTLSGAAVTIAKIVKGALWVALTGTLWGLIALLGFIAGAIGYGVRSFLGYLHTKDKYQLSLTRNLYYQNLDNNAGVIHRLLDEAEEQETREALLAYYLLWKRAPATGWTEPQLRLAAEEFLRELLGVAVDFEAHDAFTKICRLGLAQCDDSGLWTATPLPEALARLNGGWDQLSDAAP